MQAESSITHLVYKIARVVSNIGSPPVVGLFAVFVSFYAAPSVRQASWGLVYIFIAILIPVMYVINLVRQAKVTDFHLSARSERIGPFIVTLGAGLVGWLTMVSANVFPTLQLVAAINVVQTTLLLLITTQWKISIHSTAITGLAVLALYVIGTNAIPFLLSIPLVGWSRLYLKRHTMAQVMAGTFLGAILVYSAMLIHGL
ncbi:phosphatase PAP2 family protein [Chloroflexi bacterium TSY]|nr:phosphatase PAP2 family protein [Chloroflexi bacterium TSY]